MPPEKKHLKTQHTHMKKSALQKARATYQPKLPIALQGPVKVVEGRPTESVADQEAIRNLFPNTYGLPEIRFEKNLFQFSSPYFTS